MDNSEETRVRPYIGEIRLHYCTKKGCFPPTWFSESQEPESCPDCKTTSRVATPSEEHEYRNNMSHPTSSLAALFLMGNNRPQNALGVAESDMERTIAHYKQK